MHVYIHSYKVTRLARFAKKYSFNWLTKLIIWLTLPCMWPHKTINNNSWIKLTPRISPVTKLMDNSLLLNNFINRWQSITGKTPCKYGPVFAPYLHDWTLYGINTVQKRVCIYMAFFLCMLLLNHKWWRDFYNLLSEERQHKQHSSLH